MKEDGASESELDNAVGRVRELYERAVAQVPPGSMKRHWRRYIFLWLDYALFEEIETKVCAIISFAFAFTHCAYFFIIMLRRTMIAHGRSTRPQ